MSYKSVKKFGVAVCAVVCAGFVAAYLGSHMRKGAESGGAAAEGVGKSAEFGHWLSVQHAVWVDDFARAAVEMEGLSGVKANVVATTRALVSFLEFSDVKTLSDLKKGNMAVYRVGHAAIMGKNGQWKDVWAGYKNERGLSGAPFRIWSGIGMGGKGRVDEAVRFIDSVKEANASWKNFAKGLVYALAGSPNRARDYFQKVPLQFMNLSDFCLVMSFFGKFGFAKEADDLLRRWVATPGGMHMKGWAAGADWTPYDSPAKMLGFMLVQNVSHEGEAGYSDAGLLTLRAAAVLGAPNESVDYYTGGYFFAAGSDNYRKYWDRLENSLYAPFVAVKNIEKAGFSRQSARQIREILRKSPLFIPAIVLFWRQNMQNNREFNAIMALNRTLKKPDLPPLGRAYVLRMRAQSFYMNGRLDNAENDLVAASKIAPIDAGIMGLSARVWAAKRTRLDEAYRFAISLVKVFPSKIESWDTLAMVVYAKEGLEPALEILERVGRVAEECSEFFMHLGDLRMEAGSKMGAAAAYRKAIALSGDGLVIRAEVERKLRKAER